MKKNLKELEGFDLEELQSEVEEHAVEVEHSLLKLFSEGTLSNNGSNNNNNGEGQKIPVFDFEIN